MGGIKEKIENTTFELIDTADNKKIIMATRGGDTIYLNSKYDPDGFSRLWGESLAPGNAFSKAFVVGLSDGRFVKALRTANPEMEIYVYEPSDEVVDLCRNLNTITDIASSIVVAVGEDSLPGYMRIMSQLTDCANVKHTYLYISPNYEKIFPSCVKTIEQTFQYERRNAELNLGTVRLFGENFDINRKKNLLDRVDQYSIADLIDTVKAIDKKNIPAIIVSAGPSLDKNIHLLKKAKGRSFIIAVDTALNALAQAGIVPDICITIDPMKPILLLSSPMMKKVPLIYHLVSNHEILGIHEGRRFYQDSEKSVYDVFHERYDKKALFLESGGSVANDACSLAVLCQFDTIIMIGQDLAYPNNKEHSKYASYGERKNNTIDDKDDKYFYVEDNYGGKIKTQENMNHYRIWFESMVIYHPEIRFINATEGGALIHGMDFIPFEQAIRECCLRTDVDFGKVIGEIPQEFSKEQQEEILGYFANYATAISDIKRKIRDGISAYSDLERYNNKQNYSSDGFKKAFARVSEINNWVTNAADIGYIETYAAEHKLQVLRTVYDEKDSIYEDIKFSIDTGRASLENLLKVSDAVYHDYEEVIRQSRERLELIRRHE